MLLMKLNRSSLRACPSWAVTLPEAPQAVAGLLACHRHASSFGLSGECCGTNAWKSHGASSLTPSTLHML